MVRLPTNPERNPAMQSITLRLPHMPRVGLARAAASLMARVQHWRRLRETRRYLADMDEHMLHDIGVSRAQALFDVDLPRKRG